MKSIMVVDDSDADQFIIETLVTKLDSSIQLYKIWDGEEALEFLNDSENDSPSIIFLDINMPRMNGFEFLEAYRKLLEKGLVQEIPIIMYSTSEEEADKQKAQEYYVVKDYLVKPLDKDVLAKTLEKATIH